MTQSYLIVHNIGKKNNFGSLLRSAAAFGIETVYIVGEKKLKTFGHKGTVPHLKLVTCDSLEDVRHDLGSGVKICGIELTDTAQDVSHHPFYGDTAFMLGNEGTGMTDKQLTFCDYFVYVPQHSSATASLNVVMAGSIVFHHFALWADFHQVSREKMKFNVVRAPSKLQRYLDASPKGHHIEFKVLIHCFISEMDQHNAKRHSRLLRKSHDPIDYPLQELFNPNTVD